MNEHNDDVNNRSGDEYDEEGEGEDEKKISHRNKRKGVGCLIESNNKCNQLCISSSYSTVTRSSRTHSIIHICGVYVHTKEVLGVYPFF